MKFRFASMPVLLVGRTTRHWLAGVLLFAFAATVGVSPSLAQNDATVPIPAASSPDKSASGNQSCPLYQADPQNENCTESLDLVTDRTGRLLFEANVNGMGPFKFIIDTGADISAVSTRLVERLNLATTERNVVLAGVTGEYPVSHYVQLDIIKSDRFERSAVEATVIQPAVLAGADGIIGADLLRDMRVTFNFKRDRVTVEPSGPRPLARTNPTTVVQFYADTFATPAEFTESGLVLVEARIGGQTLPAIIDTGAQNTLGSDELFIAIPERRRTRWIREQTVVYGVTEHVVSATSVNATRMRLGPVSVYNAPIVFGDFHVFSAWKLEGEPVLLIGMDILSVVDQLVIDYGHEEVMIRP